MKKILLAAQRGGYAVTAPSIQNETTLRAALEAAEQEYAPMILDMDYDANEDLLFFGRMCIDLANSARVPVAINQDHGATFEEAIWGIRAGCTSIMPDRSSLPFEENAQQVRELVKIAHAVGVSVEAELGHVGSGETYENDPDAVLTIPEEAKKFVEVTGIDALAVAIGTAHGPYKGEPHLDFERLAAIRNVVDVPLVIHGGSGTGAENLKKAIKGGITKVNLGTDLYTAAVDACQESSEIPYLKSYIFKEAFRDKLVEYIRLFGQNGHADDISPSERTVWKGPRTEY